MQGEASLQLCVRCSKRKTNGSVVLRHADDACAHLSVSCVCACAELWGWAARQWYGLAWKKAVSGRHGEGQFLWEEDDSG